MLKIENLNFSYGDLKVLWDVNVEVQEGEIVTVVGRQRRRQVNAPEKHLDGSSNPVPAASRSTAMT